MFAENAHLFICKETGGAGEESEIRTRSIELQSQGNDLERAIISGVGSGVISFRRWWGNAKQSKQARNEFMPSSSGGGDQWFHVEKV